MHRLRLRAPTVPAAITLVVVGLAVLFTLAQLHPRLWFTDTTTAGGDMGAHVWGPAFMRDHLLPHGRLTGWAPSWYDGFPAYTFYFPLPALLIALLSFLLPYGMAFMLPEGRAEPARMLTVLSGDLAARFARCHPVEHVREVDGVAVVPPGAHVAAAARRHRQRGSVHVDGDLDERRVAGGAARGRLRHPPGIGRPPSGLEDPGGYWARRPTTAVMLKATWAQIAGPSRPVRTVSTAAMTPKPISAGRS